MNRPLVFQIKKRPRLTLQVNLGFLGLFFYSRFVNWLNYSGEELRRSNFSETEYYGYSVSRLTDFMTVFDFDVRNGDFQRACHFIAVEAYICFKVKFSACGGEKLSFSL